jgi:acyl dehydratase
MAEYGTLRLMPQRDKLMEMAFWKEGVSKEEHDKIVDEAVAERNAMRGMTRTLRLIGSPVPPGETFPAESAQKINEVATRDLIRHYADGIGDTNPLWRDETYARNTRWGGITVPGPFLHCIAWGTQGYPQGSPPGTNWVFYKPIKEGDTFTVYDTLGGLTEVTKPGKPRQFIESNFRTYVNQKGEIVGVAERLMIQSVRPAGNRVHKAVADLAHYKYTEEEIAAIEADYDKEVRRGAVPRYWDNVTVDEEIPQVVKGPITIMDMVAFAQCGFQYPAHGMDRDRRRWVVGHVFINRDTGISHDGGSMHYDDHLATYVAAPLATNYGEQTISWVTHMLTNWMGDDAFLRKINTRLFQYIPHGDTVWSKGKVVKKYEEDGKFLVDIDFECINQRQFKVAGGSATIQLMAIGKGIMTI